MDYHQEAIETLFDCRENMRQVIDDVLYNFDADGLSFPDAMNQFFHDFETIASELVAAKVLGVNLSHYYVRSSNAMSACDVQSLIETTKFKDFDKCVARLFAEFDAGDYASANETYNSIWANRKLDVPKLTKARLNRYLDEVCNATDRKLVDFSRLSRFADDQKPDKKSDRGERA